MRFCESHTSSYDNDDDDNDNDGGGDGMLLPQQKGHEWHCLYFNIILQIQMKFSIKSRSLTTLS